LRRNQNQSAEENRAVLKRIRDLSDNAGLAMVAYISMGFGNPYGDPWNETKVAEAAKSIADLGVNAISIADTAGVAGSELVGRVVTAVMRDIGDTEVGVHMHSTRAGARANILAAYDAGCRRFDAALGGLGGCPFAQDELIGNVPTEEVLRALEQRGVAMPLKGRVSRVLAMNAMISDEFSEGDMV
jgi:hydroxymethylglutaryl-CoA lyase